MMPVVIEVGGGVQFLQMIAGRLIFRYRRPDLGRVEVVVGWDWAMCKAGAELKPNPKTELPGLSFGQLNVGGSVFW